MNLAMLRQIFGGDDEDAVNFKGKHYKLVGPVVERWNPHRKTLATLDRILCLLDEQPGVPLTCRQVHYQFVARGWKPNTQATYNHVQMVLKMGRRSGVIPQGAVEDRTRAPRVVSTWDDAAAAIGALSDQFAIDLWVGQGERPELWLGKRCVALEPRRCSSAVPGSRLQLSRRYV